MAGAAFAAAALAFSVRGGELGFEACFAAAFTGCLFSAALAGVGSFFGVTFVAFAAGRVTFAGFATAFVALLAGAFAAFFGAIFVVFAAFAAFAAFFGTAFVAFFTTRTDGAAFFTAFAVFAAVDFRAAAVRSFAFGVFAGIDSRSSCGLKVRQVT